MKRITTLLAIAATTLSTSAVHAASFFPWDEPLCKLTQNFLGTTSFPLILIALFAVGGVLIFFGDLERFALQSILLVLGASVLLYANNLIGILGGASTPTTSLDSLSAEGQTRCDIMNFGKPKFFDTSFAKRNSSVDAQRDECSANEDIQTTGIELNNRSSDNKRKLPGNTISYRWNFKLGDAFCPLSKKISSIHRLEAHDEKGTAPVVNLASYVGQSEQLLLVYTDRTQKKQRLLIGKPFEPFKGKWISAVETIKYGKKGSYSLALTQSDNGESLLSYTNADIDLGFKNARSIQPKWGKQ